MNLFRSTTTTPIAANSMNRWPLRRALLLIPLVLSCFALLPRAQALIPVPDGGYPNGNTAEGSNPLIYLTTGGNNTSIGDSALYHNEAGSNNTATGARALFSNTNSTENTATGWRALFSNTTG